MRICYSELKERKVIDKLQRDLITSIRQNLTHRSVFAVLLRLIRRYFFYTRDDHAIRWLLKYPWNMIMHPSVHISRLREISLSAEYFNGAHYAT